MEVEEEEVWVEDELSEERREVALPAKWFRGGLVFKAHRWLYHSTRGSRVIKKKKVQIVFLDCLDLYHKSPDSGARQYKPSAK